MYLSSFPKISPTMGLMILIYSLCIGQHCQLYDLYYAGVEFRDYSERLFRMNAERSFVKWSL